MKIVFTMAGKYTRFKPFGARVPKYLLPLGQSTVLSNIIQTIRQTKCSDDFIFVANRNDQLFYPVLKSILLKYNLSPDRVIFIDDTASQLETALRAGELIGGFSKDDSVCFANIDTIVSNRDHFFKTLSLINQTDALVDTFPGRSAKYSFARVDNQGQISEIVDNSVISDFACSGLYGFGSFNEMADLAICALKENYSANFTYLLNKFINNGHIVKNCHSLSKTDTVVLGTPEEYLINIHRFAK